MLNPKALNKDDLRDMSYKTKPEYGFMVNVERDVPGQENLILQNVDEQLAQFSACFDITDRGEEAREYPIAIVNGTSSANTTTAGITGNTTPITAC